MTSQHRPPRRVLPHILVAVAFMAAGLFVNQVSSGHALAKTLKFSLITKMGSDPWFISEGAGALSQAKALNVQLTRQDVGLNTSLAVSAMETIVGKHPDGLMIVPPTTAIGPAMVGKAEAAHIPVLSIDDFVNDPSGKQIPWVGTDWSKAGTIAGKEVAKLYKKDNWGSKPRSQVAVASIELQTLSVCMLRNNHAQAAFLKQVKGFPTSQILHIPYDGTLNGALNSMPAVITAHPGVKYWMIWSCNDDGVIGAWRALKAKGFTAKDVNGVAQGGMFFCSEWNPGRPSGLKAMVFSNPRDEGKLAVRLMYQHVAMHKALPAKSQVPITVLTQKTYRSVTSCH